jgi:hypothetical protein
MAHAENHRFSIAVLTADSIAYKIFMRYTYAVLRGKRQEQPIVTLHVHSPACWLEN